MKKTFLTALLIMSVFFVNVSAQDKTLSVTGAEAEVGENISVAVSLNGTSASVGSVTLEYNSDVLSVETYDYSEAFSEVSAFFNPAYAENQIKFNWLTMEEDIDFTDFLTIEFKCLKNGLGELEFVKYDLYDINEKPVKVTAETAEIKVGTGIEEDKTDEESPEETPDENETEDTENSGTSSSGSSSSSSGGSGSSNKSNSVTKKDDKTESTSDEKITEEVKKEEEKEEIRKNISFADLNGYEWAKDSIAALAEKGIINGVSETEFAPSAMITRADFMCLLIRMSGIKTEFADNFDDVLPDKYYYGELGTAKASGIATGDGNNKFLPENNITRQDMFTLVYRFLKMSDIAYEEADTKILEQYADCGDIAEYAHEASAVLIQNGFVTGSNGKICPEQNATRAETAVLIYRLYNYLQQN